LLFAVRDLRVAGIRILSSSIRIASFVFGYTFLASGYPPCSSPFHIRMLSWAFELDFRNPNASSCIQIPSASAARFCLQYIRMPCFAFEYPIQASECLVMHSDTPAQKFKINFQQVKIVLFSIKIVYFFPLLKIILV